MTTISENLNLFTLMVTFQVTPETQEEARRLIEAYIGDFIAQQPGFVSANLHASHCGTRLVNYAQWRSAADFEAFRQAAQARPELTMLRRYQPAALFFDVVKTFSASA